MSYRTIKRIQDLHNKVIHSNEYTDKEYLQEDRLIKRQNDATLNLVCPGCFPLNPNPGYVPVKRTAETYDIRYPVIHKIIWDQANI